MVKKEIEKMKSFIHKMYENDIIDGDLRYNLLDYLGNINHEVEEDDYKLEKLKEKLASIF